MSVDMEQAEPYGDVVQFDQEGYHLDLDAGVDANDIDLQLETFDTEVQYQISSTDPDNGLANQTDDIEIGFEEENVMGVDDHHEEQTEPNHGQASADVDVEYGDEIGYEDDEDGGDDADDGATGTATEPDLSAPHTVSDKSKHDNGSQEAYHEEFALDRSYDDASLHEEHADQEDGADASVLNGSTSSVDDTDIAPPMATHELEQAASSNTELEQVDGASGDTPELPYVEVHYKETRYSLFGTPEDDPDSYFLSEPKHLDIPLYEFLIAIRHVVEDELSAHDELNIRIPSLSLEFGERSRESFLRAHNFREIHQCWSRLFFDDDVEESSYLVLHLVVCPVPEHRFAELLTQAVPPRASALPEGSGEYSGTPGAIGFEDDGKDGNATKHYTDANAGNFEDNFEDESAAVSKAESGQSAVEVQEFEAHDGHNGEGDSLEVVADEQHLLPLNETGLGKAEEETYYEEHHMADRDEDEDGDVIEDQEFPEADDDVPLEIGADYEDGDIIADVEVGVTGETEVSDIGAGVETALEFYEEEINIELGGDPSLAPHEPPNGTDSHGDTQGQNGYRDDNSAAPTDQEESNHTSATSTVDGDEIDYEDNAVEDDSFAMNADSNQQPDLDVEEGDEIDWRNDEDEEDSAVPPTAESPSSVSAKRSRTDDVDHLVDEADHKRRRT